jgi:mannose-1-phosphate guanylyltransferase
MNALLLAAGKGTRLRPITDHVPKCLVEVGGRPLLDIWLEDLAHAGFDRFLVNTHYLHEQVELFLRDHPLRHLVTTAFEQELLGTAGTVLQHHEFFQGGTTLVAHADNFCACNWRAFVDAHRNRPAGTEMTMMTFETPTPSSCGIVALDGAGIVKQFFEKVPDPPGNLANAAVYLMEPSLVDYMRTQEPGATDISVDVLPRILGRIFTWHNRETLIDIGTPASLSFANSLVAAGGKAS